MVGMNTMPVHRTYNDSMQEFISAGLYQLQYVW